MRARDYVDEILGSFRKQRLRTALTAIGIGISAFTITLMVGLGQGLQTYIETQILAFHNDRVLMVIPARVQLGARVFDRLAAVGRPARRLTEEDDERRKIQRGGLWITDTQVEAVKQVPGVEAISPMTWLSIDGISLADANEAQSGRWQVDFGALDNSPLVGELSHGRANDPEKLEVILSPQYALAWGMGYEELIGREVVVRVPKLSQTNRRFLFRDPTAYTDEHTEFTARVAGLSEKSPISRAVFASVALGREMVRYQSGNEKLLSDQKIGFQAHVRLAPGTDPEEVKKAIEEHGLIARSVGESIGEIQQVFLVVDLVLASFGLLALFVATLGIINTLLMAITERTREIGVMKALGMTRQSIRRMFALEAAAIGFVGGIGGTGLAIVLGLIGNVAAKEWVPAAQGLEGYEVFYFPVWLMLGAPLFASLIGGVAGIYPANRAARLDPIEALHHD